MKYSKIKEVISPNYGTKGSAGIDFYVPEFTKEFVKHFDEINSHIDFDYHNGEIRVHSAQRVLIPSGIKVDVPKGYALIGFNKSGVASKTGLILGPQVIDEDYQGEIFFGLINTSNKTVIITRNMKIVQLLLIPIAKPKELYEVPIEELYNEETDRKDGGFGSTGV